MRRFAKRSLKLLGEFGFKPAKLLRSVRGVPAFLRDYRRLKAQRPRTGAPSPFGRLYPCLGDRYEECGTAKGQFSHQDLLVARRVHAVRPRVHLDVGSRLDGFVAHVASFREIGVIDIRAMTARIPNVRFIQADLTIPETGTNCV